MNIGSLQANATLSTVLTYSSITKGAKIASEQEWVISVTDAVSSTPHSLEVLMKHSEEKHEFLGN